MRRCGLGLERLAALVAATRADRLHAQRQSSTRRRPARPRTAAPRQACSHARCNEPQGGIGGRRSWEWVARTLSARRPHALERLPLPLALTRWLYAALSAFAASAFFAGVEAVGFACVRTRVARPSDCNAARSVAACELKARHVIGRQSEQVAAI